MSAGYRITKRPGRRWWDFPYQVTRNGQWVGMAFTNRGARLLVRKDKREQAAGVHVVWTEETL